jgi:hypothetical protein
MRIRGASTNFSSDPIDRECSIETSVAKVWLHFEKGLNSFAGKSGGRISNANAERNLREVHEPPYHSGFIE